MTIQECYQKLNGDFSQISSRLPSVALVERFLGKFLLDDSYPALCRAMEEGDRETAFRAAHSLKGVCANLCLGQLLASASRLTELLRPETPTIPEDAGPLFQAVAQDYALTTEVIRTYLDSRAPQA